MALRESPRFARADVPLSADLATALAEHRPSLNDTGWVYCGYPPLPSVPGLAPPTVDIGMEVNNASRLGTTLGFERAPAIVTAGLRTSRFAPVLFWEVLHALKPGGLWLDIDDEARCHGTPLIDVDPLDREYFRALLGPESSGAGGGVRVQRLRKHGATPLAAHVADPGWSFGILTSGPSPRAADMTRAILALDLPQVEVVICGPRPAGLPVDERIRVIDLDRPEPRGWITRKKNLIAAEARFDNLCLLHDRYIITPAWAAALQDYGPAYAFLTFPQVYYADTARRFAQRYPDYQVLYQQRGIEAALATNTYDGTRIFHPAYDDFADTAFACGGLYVARRCLWNSVRQDEGLYHCEWEDVSFGLDCQRRGLPHRVNPLLTVESAAPHPLLLTRIHDLPEPDRPERRRLHVSGAQADAAQKTPHIFKPLFASTREDYYASVRARFNAIHGVGDAERLTPDVTSDCRGLADFWRTVQAHVDRLAPQTRDAIAAVGFFLSDTVYKWPNCHIQAWTHHHERGLASADPLASFPTIVGWGTGSLFSTSHRLIGRPLAFAVDSDPRKWNAVIDTVAIRPPAALRELDAHRTAVVIFSCFVDEIAAAVGALGPYATFPATDLTASRRFQPLADLVAYFEEVERFYPTPFTAAQCEAAA